MDSADLSEGVLFFRGCADSAVFMEPLFGDGYTPSTQLRDVPRPTTRCSDGCCCRATLEPSKAMDSDQVVLLCNLPGEKKKDGEKRRVKRQARGLSTRISVCAMTPFWLTWHRTFPEAMLVGELLGPSAV